jgi:D-alanyl-D-alanine carboxypeptidase/D-alanyl-D-alanine-endopeptidase (penicillin-binding protein 4)
MRRGPAHRRCVGKTGTLSDVSALSGYCEATNGNTYAYSILMNHISPTGARLLQDRMLQKIAADER